MFRHLLGRRYLWIVRGKRGKPLDEYSFLTTFIIVRRSHEFLCCSWRHMRGCKLGRATLFEFVLSHYTLLCPSRQCFLICDRSGFYADNHLLFSYTSNAFVAWTHSVEREPNHAGAIIHSFELAHALYFLCTPHSFHMYPHSHLIQ